MVNENCFYVPSTSFLMKYMYALSILLVSSCSMMLPNKSFVITDAKIREFRVNKIKNVYTLEKFTDDKSNTYIEIIFNSDVNFFELMIDDGYFLFGKFKYNDKPEEPCIIYGENRDIKSTHLSLLDLMGSKTYIAEHLKNISGISIYKYSCIINKSVAINNEITFYVKLTNMTKYHYISNKVKIKLLEK